MACEAFTTEHHINCTCRQLVPQILFSAITQELSWRGFGITNLGLKDDADLAVSDYDVSATKFRIGYFLYVDGIVGLEAPARGNIQMPNWLCAENRVMGQ